MNEEMLNDLAAALGGDEPEPPPAKKPAAQAAPEPDDDVEEIEITGVAEEGEPDDEDPGEEEEQEDRPEGADSLTLVGPDGEPMQMKLDDLLKETLHDVEIGGEKRQVSYDDLRKGFMLQEDYTRKTQEVARSREELAPYADMVAYAKNDPQFVQYMQAYFVHGADPVAGLSKYSNVSDDQLSAMLASDDPDDLARARDIARERAELRKRVSESQQKQQRISQERAQMWQQWAAIEQQRARESIPDYDNALKGHAEYLSSLGFVEQEIKFLADHRIMQVLADALEGRRLKEKSTSPKSELASKRKQTRPSRSISSGRGKPENSVQTRSRKAEQRAKESGDLSDWADVIGSRLGL